MHVVNPSGNWTISGMTIRDAGVGIQIGGPPSSATSQPIAVEKLVTELRYRLDDLPAANQVEVRALLEKIEAEPTDEGRITLISTLVNLATSMVGSALWTYIQTHLR